MAPECYHSSGSPRLRKSRAKVTTNQSFDLVASPTKLERALSKGSQVRGMDRLGFYARCEVKRVV